ncbi:MAG: ABC transporter permease [Bacteroidota bacterium]
MPTLFAVTAIGFILLANAPGDPVNTLSNASKASGNIEAQKTFWRQKLGLNLPLFYFSVTTLSSPDTLYKVYDEEKLKVYKALLQQTGNPEAIHHFQKELKNFRTTYEFEKTRFINSNDSAKVWKLQTHLNGPQEILKQIDYQSDLGSIKVFINTLHNCKAKNWLNISSALEILSESFDALYDSKTAYKNYIPKIHWYGFQNRYHQWLFGGPNSKGIVRGDFGVSYTRNEPVITILKEKLIWSVFFSVISILLAYAISIPIGIGMAEKPNSKFTTLTRLTLFILYALPSFFVGVVLLMLFANPDTLPIFPPSGIKPISGYDDDASLLSKFIDSLPYMILPLICYTYSSLAFISRLTTTSINEQLHLDYIKTARAKGLRNKTVLWKHALKNSALPLITVFSSIFPAIIGGSVIIESIFTIPGMGLETVRAIMSQDYPIVIAVITLSSVLTIISYLMADLLYAWVDPRIRTG